MTPVIAGEGASPGGMITEIIDSTGDGMGNGLDEPFGVATDGSAR